MLLFSNVSRQIHRVLSVMHGGETFLNVQNCVGKSLKEDSIGPLMIMGQRLEERVMTQNKYTLDLYFY